MKTFAALVLIALPLTLVNTWGQALAPSAETSAHGALRNVDMSMKTGNEAETAAAVNHLRPQQITSLSNLESGGLFHSWSSDGGRTWQHNVIANGDALGNACCDGQLASDDFGNIFLTYLDSSIAVKMAISTDGGATFQPLPFLTSLPSGLPVMPWKSLAAVGQTISGDQPSIAAGAGSVWISWTSFDGTVQASGAMVTGLGQVGLFSRAQKIPGGHNGGDYGDIAVGPEGQVFVVYQDPTGGEGPATIYGALDPDGLGPAGFNAAQTLQTTNVGGFDFIPAQSGRSVDAEAGLAWDNTNGPHRGRLYFIYVSEEPRESNDMDIELRYSDDNGQSWTNPARVNDDVGTNSQFNPKISLDATSGKLAIGWYDARNDAGDHGQGDTNGQPNDDVLIYATISRDGGETFQHNFRLSLDASNDNGARSGVDYGDYSGFAYYNGRLYFSAADNSNSTGENPDGTLQEFDLYVAPITVR